MLHLGYYLNIKHTNRYIQLSNLYIHNHTGTGGNGGNQVIWYRTFRIISSNLKKGCDWCVGGVRKPIKKKKSLHLALEFFDGIP